MPGVARISVRSAVAGPGFWLAAIAAVIATSSPASAQRALPDPASVTLPDVTPVTDPQLRDDGLKFFYFYKPGVSFAQAYADIQDCQRFLVAGPAVLLPGFVPWVEGGKRKTIESTPNYGMVGAIIGDLLAGPLERSRRNTNMRVCMEPRGYVRYPMLKASWHAINDGDVPTAILKQAKLASGPVPNDQVLTQ